MHVIYIVKRARLSFSYARLPPSILPSFLSYSLKHYPDPIIVFSFIQNNFQFKNIAKTYLLLL